MSSRATPFIWCRPTTTTTFKAWSTPPDSDLRINGGYFAFKHEIFDYIQPGEDLVEEPFARLSKARLLFANTYDGFWAPMDTLKDQQRLEQMVESGNGPWKVWELEAADETQASLEQTEPA